MDLLDSGLQEAIVEYNLLLKEDGRWNVGPYLVSEAISRSTYEQWVDTQEAHWRLSWEEGDEVGVGRVMLYGDPSGVHAKVSGWVKGQFVVELIRLGIKHLFDIVDDIAVHLPRGIKEPDGGIYPVSAQLDDCPTVVLEVAYRNESRSALLQELKDWTSKCNFAIGILIVEERHTIKLFCFTRKQGATRSTSRNFSEHVCSSPNSSMLKVPVEVVFPSLADVPPSLAGQHLSIDLWMLQRRILDLFVRRSIAAAVADG